MKKISAKLVEKYRNFPLPVKTSLVYVFFSVLQKGIAFLVVPVYTRMVSTEQYGIYSTYLSWESIICIFATLNMWNYQFSNGMLKFDNRDKYTSALIGLSGVTTCVTFSLLFFAKKNHFDFKGMTTELLIIMFVHLLLRPSYEYWCARQRFEYNIKKYIISALVITVLTPITAIVFIQICKRINLNYTGTALVFGRSLSEGIVYLLVCYLVLKKSNVIYDKKIWKHALKFSVPLIPHFLSTIILSQCDRIMISSMCGYEQTAVYSVAYTVGAVMVLFNAAIMDSIIPWMYKKLRNNDYSGIKQVSCISMVGIAVINILISLCAPEIIALLAPNEYQQAMYIVPPVAISNVFIFLFNLYANIEYFYEETKKVAIASGISAIANILLNYVYIRRFGFLVAGYTTVICYMIYAFCHFGLARYALKKHEVKSKVYDSRWLWCIACASLVLSLLVIKIYSYFWLRMTFVLLFFIAVFLIRKKIFACFSNLLNRGVIQNEKKLIE